MTAEVEGVGPYAMKVALKAIEDAELTEVGAHETYVIAKAIQQALDDDTDRKIAAQVRALSTVIVDREETMRSALCILGVLRSQSMFMHGRLLEDTLLAAAGKLRDQLIGDNRSVK